MDWYIRPVKRRASPGRRVNPGASRHQVLIWELGIPKGLRLFLTLALMRSMMSLGLNISGPPPPVHHISAQPQDEFGGVGLAGTGLGAESAVETPPEFLSLLEDFFRRPHLDIADHLPGKMLKDEGADGRTGAAVKALQGGVDAKGFKFFGKIRIYQCHVRSFSKGRCYSAGSVSASAAGDRGWPKR